MREFLLELYLKHGEREFNLDTLRNEFWAARENGYLMHRPLARWPTYYITPKAIEYIKNLDNQ